LTIRPRPDGPPQDKLRGRVGFALVQRSFPVCDRVTCPKAVPNGGFAALSLMLGLAFVVMPVLVLVLSLPVWLERAAAAQDAARLAARELATAPDWAEGTSQAQSVVWQLAKAEGWSAASYSLDFAGTLMPAGTVSARVRVAVPVTVVPFLGPVGHVEYSAVSVAHVDSYRSGP
jgi:hypothetical protein